MVEPQQLIRSFIRDLAPYIPGEQPAAANALKLNTNENPYPPAPEVLSAVRDCVDGRLRRYPSPTSAPLRKALAAYHGCAPENIIVGNGSDELLALAIRCFVTPISEASSSSGSVVQYFDPSYSLYPILSRIHHVRGNAVSLNPDFSIPDLQALQEDAAWDEDAALTFITTPNAPSARGYTTDQLRSICATLNGVVILDEAYADFAEENAAELGFTMPHVMVSRTFSKAFSLCYQRVGYFIGDPVLIGAMDKIRDSYNVNGLGQVAALETLRRLDYYQERIEWIQRERALLMEALEPLGFESLPSAANFVLTRPTRGAAKSWFDELRKREIYVRWFDHPRVRDYLRISIGSSDEMARLIAAMREIWESV